MDLKSQKPVRTCKKKTHRCTLGHVGIYWTTFTRVVQMMKIVRQHFKVGHSSCITQANPRCSNTRRLHRWEIRFYSASLVIQHFLAQLAPF